MGTKNKPGQYDCYKNAEPDEPMFVLLARDPLAPILVKMWAELREESTSGDDDVIDEARECADAMERWRKRHRPGKRLTMMRQEKDENPKKEFGRHPPQGADELD
jgi:hypothetical protein